MLLHFEQKEEFTFYNNIMFAFWDEASKQLVFPFPISDFSFS